MKEILIYGAIGIAIMLIPNRIKVHRNKKHRFCIVVEEVRHNGDKTAIKPKCQDPKYKGEMPWYRYPTPNIHPGDTVDVSLNELIEPKF